MSIVRFSNMHSWTHICFRLFLEPNALPDIFSDFHRSKTWWQKKKIVHNILRIPCKFWIEELKMTSSQTQCDCSFYRTKQRFAESLFSYVLFTDTCRKLHILQIIIWNSAGNSLNYRLNAFSAICFFQVMSKYRISIWHIITENKHSGRSCCHLCEVKLRNSLINSDAAKSWINLFPLCLCDILLFFWVIRSNKFQKCNQKHFRPQTEGQAIQRSWSCCSWRSTCREIWRKILHSAHWMEKHCNSFMFINEKVVSFTIILDVIQVWLEFKWKYFPVTLKGTTDCNPPMQFKTFLGGNNWTYRNVCCHT